LQARGVARMLDGVPGAPIPDRAAATPGGLGRLRGSGEVGLAADGSPEKEVIQ